MLTRPAVGIALGVAAGLLAAPAGWWAWSGAVAMVAAAWLARHNPGRGWALRQGLWAVGLGLLLGLGRGTLEPRELPLDHVGRLATDDPTPWMLTGRVVEPPTHHRVESSALSWWTLGLEVEAAEDPDAYDEAADDFDKPRAESDADDVEVDLDRGDDARPLHAIARPQARGAEGEAGANDDTEAHAHAHADAEEDTAYADATAPGGQGAAPRGRRVTGRVDVFLRPDGAAGVALASLRRGDRLRVEGDLSRLPVARNPGQLDLRAMRAQQGIHATHSMRQWDRLEVLERAEGFSLGRAVDRARDAIQAALAAGLAPNTRALAEAIVIGRRQSLPDATLDAFERTGTYHLLAISGLHAALVAGALFLVLRLVRTPRHLAALIVLLATWAYALLADLRPSVVRASVMVTAYLIAPVLRRDADGLNALGLAALVLLLVRPRELEQVGFQLSFLAVAALIAVAAPLGRAARDRIVRREGPLLARLARRAAFAVAALAIASAVAWAATQPLVQLHFHIVTPLALVANLASSALLGLALAAVLVYLLAAFLLPAAAPLAAAAADGASAWLLDPIAWLGALPIYAYLPRLHPVQAVIALGLLTVAAVALVRAVGAPASSLPRASLPAPSLAPSVGPTSTSLGRRRWATPLAVAGIALVLAAASLRPFGPRAVPDGTLRLTVLDVSHGQAALLETPGGGVALFDCGSSRIKPGRRVVAPAIWDAGYARIDHVFLSHPDADHTNGVLDLADRVAIGDVYVAPAFLAEPRGAAVLAALAARGVPTRAVRAGEAIALTGGAVAHVIAAPELPPGTPNARQSNDASLVVRVALGPRAVLAPGDVQEAGTRRLLDASPGGALACDVLLVPHHGARNRHTAALARAAGPRLAVASGRKRSAARSTLVALEAERARVLETWQLGAVGVELAPDGVRWRAFLGGW